MPEFSGPWFLAKLQYGVRACLLLSKINNAVDILPHLSDETLAAKGGKEGLPHYKAMNPLALSQVVHTPFHLPLKRGVFTNLAFDK